MIDPHKPDYTNTPVSPSRPGFHYEPERSGEAPVVSIVTPFYNPGAIFGETAQSVRAQSLQQWEWLIVDDGSDDEESLRALSEVEAADGRVRVLKTAGRKGPAAARNLGVEQARTGYVVLIDSDDLFEPTALEKWLWFLETHPGFAMVKGYQVGFGEERYLWREGFHNGRGILERNPVQTSSMMRRAVYMEAGGMDETIKGGMEDWDFWLRVADRGHWGGTVAEYLDWYRRRENHSDRWEDWDDARRQEEFRARLRERYPRLYGGHFPEPEYTGPKPFELEGGRPGFENRLKLGAGQRRVLVIVPHLELGGSDKFTLDLIGELTGRHGYEVTVAATLTGGHSWRHNYERLTPDVFTLATFLRLRDYPRFLSYLARSRQVESVLVVHSQMGYQLLPYLRAELPGVRFYDSVHIEEPVWKEGGYPAYSLAYRRLLDHTVSASEHLKRWMTARGGEAERISTVTINIDAGKWRRESHDAQALREKWKIEGEAPVILFAGRLCEQKQPNVLAATARLLDESGARYQMLVAGDGELMGWLKGAVGTHHLGQVRLLGARTSEEVRELLAVSDVFFLPSRHEGIAMSLYEAMAMKVVVVGADVGGQKELVTPECGVLIEPGGDEAKRYAEEMGRLLGEPARRQAMGEAGRRRVEAGFTLEQMGAEVAMVLRGERDRAPVELGEALAAMGGTLAREVVEQARLETVADTLWRKAHAPAAAAAGDEGSARRREWAVLRAMGILKPLVAGGGHGANRRALVRVLMSGRMRAGLGTGFDADYYCCTNPDIPAAGPLPLLHYVFQGYKEGRKPAAGAPGAAGRGGVNPLLARLLSGC